MSVEVLVIPADRLQPTRRETIEGNLVSRQALVGGTVRRGYALAVDNGPRLGVWVNDNDNSLLLDANVRATILVSGTPTTPVRGDVFLMAEDTHGAPLKSLPDWADELTGV